MDLIKKEGTGLLPTLITIGVSIFLVSGIVVAATTIGSSLSTDGNLTVLGNVGIGTSTPSARFSFTGDGMGATRAFVFADSNNTERLTLLNNGNVGVGTTSPQALFSLNAPAGQASFVIGSSSATSLIVDKNGNVGIGTPNPQYALDIAGNSVLWQSVYGSDDDLIGWWPLNEAGGTIAYDYSPLGNDGTLDDTTNITRTAGKYGTGLKFSNAKAVRVQPAPMQPMARMFRQLAPELPGTPSIPMASTSPCLSTMPA